MTPDTLIIPGARFHKAKNLEVTVRGQECKITKVSSNKLQCKLANSLKAGSHAVTVTSKWGIAFFDGSNYLDLLDTSMCDENIALDCIGEDVKGREGCGYKGCQSLTESGDECQPWNCMNDDSCVNKHNYRQFEFLRTYYVNETVPHNYCRNTVGSFGKPWCYTTNRRRPIQKCEPLIDPDVSVEFVKTQAWDVDHKKVEPLKCKRKEGVAAVKCCDNNGNGRSPDCTKYLSTYSQAEYTCKKAGLRLCTYSELNNPKQNDNDNCGFGKIRTWSSTLCDLEGNSWELAMQTGDNVDLWGYDGSVWAMQSLDEILSGQLTEYAFDAKVGAAT